MAHAAKAACFAGQARLVLAAGTKPKVLNNLSGVALAGDHLWLAADEGAALERLTPDGRGSYDQHVRFSLTSLSTPAGPFVLPGGPNEEADLEALGYDAAHRRLWFCGSHDLARGKIDPGSPPPDPMAALAVKPRQLNRFLLGSIKLDEAGDPVAGSMHVVPFGGRHRGLVDVIPPSSLLAAFLEIPSKDNGFDIEGLAVRDGTVFVGLRGPVLRGWASILQVRFGHSADGTLTPKDPSAPCLHHLLGLDGLGVRDLAVDGDDLLILAGPTMLLDGPIRLFRWRGGASLSGPALVESTMLDYRFDIATGVGNDHAEGITLIKPPTEGPMQLLVVFDNPAPSRIAGTTVTADLFKL